MYYSRILRSQSCSPQLCNSLNFEYSLISRSQRQHLYNLREALTAVYEVRRSCCIWATPGSWSRSNSSKSFTQLKWCAISVSINWFYIERSSRWPPIKQPVLNSKTESGLFKSSHMAEAYVMTRIINRFFHAGYSRAADDLEKCECIVRTIISPLMDQVRLTFDSAPLMMRRVQIPCLVHHFAK